MSVDFMSGFDAKTRDDKPYVSFALSEEAKALFPELAKFKLSMFYLQPEERKSENSPSYKVIAFIPRPKEEEKAHDTIPF